MLVASFAFRVKASKVPEFLAVCRSLTARTRNLPGCLEARLTADVGDRQSWVLIVEWSDRAAYMRFTQSTEYCVMRGMRFLMTTSPVAVVDEVARRERTVWTET